MKTLFPHQQISLFLAALLLVVPLFSACSDDATTSPDASPAAEKYIQETSLVDLFRADATSCAEASAKDCFSNLDCPTERRCQSLDGAGAVVCCLPGARGTKQAGETCTQETDCASAVCIGKGASASVCSKDCASADDCPAGMKDCKAIAFSGSAQKWCFPQ
ncbi:MAG: hypothetical protein KAI47_17080 [Deltaproteobacteria bacterium]|nr:hypothetical protein [Deltaproteobacteria bacterium]